VLFRSLLLETRKNSTVLPTAAILRGPQGTFVYLVKPDKTVEARTVTISLSQGNITVIASGLNPGDTVVTDGQDKLQTGSTIEPRSGSPSNTPSGRNGSGNPTLGTPASGTPAS
jgi:multidrug efflux system membrane fusion protein